MPSVSIVIPTYKHCDYVLRTLDSVFAQTFTDYEVVVVNDGSPDDTQSVLRPLTAAGRIQYIEQANQGQAAARNRGLAAARGEYIAFLDDDDLWPADKLSWQVEFLEQHPDVAMIVGPAECIDSADQTFETYDCGSAITFETLFSGNPIVSPGQTLLRTSVMKDVGGFDTAIWGADDWDLWFRIAQGHRIETLSRSALLYRVHAGNASKQKRRMLNASFRVIDLHSKQLSQSKQSQLRKVAHEQLYEYLGVLMLRDAKSYLKSGKLPAAVSSLAGVLALCGRMSHDGPATRRLLKDLVGKPLLHRARVRKNAPPVKSNS